MKKIVFLTGAGMSQESGISTFRDQNGLWENHDIMEVASPQGFARNPELVLNFYNARRQQLFDVEPNRGHELIAELEKNFEVHVITQNVDDLHERAGSSRVLHLHGELRKVRSTKDPQLVYDWQKDLFLGDLCELNSQLRPHIVWFGEEVPMMTNAIDIISNAHIVVTIGTSLQVYPAAGLMHYAPNDIPQYYIDPFPSLQIDQKVRVIAEKASVGMEVFIEHLKNLS